MSKSGDHCSTYRCRRSVFFSPFIYLSLTLCVMQKMEDDDFSSSSLLFLNLTAGRQKRIRASVSRTPAMLRKLAAREDRYYRGAVPLCNSLRLTRRAVVRCTDHGFLEGPFATFSPERGSIFTRPLAQLGHYVRSEGTFSRCAMGGRDA